MSKASVSLREPLGAIVDVIKKGDYSTSGHNDINRVVVGVYVSGIQISTATVAAVTAWAARLSRA